MASLNVRMYRMTLWTNSQSSTTEFWRAILQTLFNQGVFCFLLGGLLTIDWPPLPAGVVVVTVHPGFHHLPRGLFQRNVVPRAVRPAWYVILKTIEYSFVSQTVFFLSPGTAWAGSRGSCRASPGRSPGPTSGRCPRTLGSREERSPGRYGILTQSPLSW